MQFSYVDLVFIDDIEVNFCQVGCELVSGINIYGCRVFLRLDLLQLCSSHVLVWRVAAPPGGT